MMKRTGLQKALLCGALAVGCTVFAQEEKKKMNLKDLDIPKTESLMPFEHMIDFSFRVGLEGSGARMSYLYNRKEQVSGWDFMVGGEAVFMNVYDDDEYEAQVGFFEPQLALTKSVHEETAYLLLKAGLPLGTEQYEDEFERDQSKFLLGISAQQNLMYLPSNWNGVLVQVGLYEYIIPGSKVYPFDLGLQLGIGYKF